MQENDGSTALCAGRRLDLAHFQLHAMDANQAHGGMVRDVSRGLSGRRCRGMLHAMTLFLDSFWRAVAYCLHPRVIALSFLPLVIMVALSLGLGYFFWDAALDWVRALLDASDLLTTMWALAARAWARATCKSVLAPLIVMFAVTPLIVIVSLLLVAALMTPALVALVAERRFPQLERKKRRLAAGQHRSGRWAPRCWPLIALVVSHPAVADAAA